MIKSNTSIVSKRVQLPYKFRLFLLALPFLVLVLIFSYAPLLGWLLAFFNYRPGLPLKASDFVGAKWFSSIVGNPIQRLEIIRILRNTIVMSFLGIVTSVVPVAFAIFLSEIRNTTFKKSVQVLTTLPNFISWVLVYSFAFSLFSYDNGLFNSILVKLGLITADQRFNILANPDTNWTIWIQMILWSLWKCTGWNAILYIAAISGIDQEQYEAAKVDGAGRFAVMRYITLPGISETYFVILLLSLANFINNGMDQYFVFQNAMNKSFLEVLDLYVYNTSMVGSGNFPYSIAISMLKSIISLSLLFFANRMSKLVRGQTII
jgi:putative aldouronate transport system permease protein